VPPPPGSAEVLVGRDDELALLAGLLDGLRAGRGRAVWLEGEPGIGKSALAGWLTARASTVDCQLYRGAGQELVRPLPLRLMAESLGVSARSADPLRAEIAGLLRQGAATGTADPVLAAGERLVELVDRCCAVGPVLLVTEDLHWADEASLQVWYQLAAAVDQIPLLLVGSCGLVPRPPELLRLRRAVEDVGAVLMPLGPLDPGRAAELAGRLVDATPGPRLRDELAQAGGNPLYVRELVGALARDGLIEVAGGSAELPAGAGTPPISLATAIDRRLRFLTEDTRSVLRVAAVLGAGFPVTELATAVGRPVGALVPAIEEAVAAGVLSPGAHRMVFRHDLIRQVLAAELPAPVRTALHGQLARQLADAGRPIGEVAAHLLAVPGALDGWALTWLADLPDASLHAAPQGAAELLARAAAQAAGGPRWETLASRQAAVLNWLLRYDEVEQVAGAVLRNTADPELAGRMATIVVTAARHTGRYEQSMTTARQALADPALPVRWRGRLRARHAMTLLFLGQDAAGTEQARQALAEAEQAGDPLGTGWALHAVSWLSDPVPGLAEKERALAALTDDDPESVDLRMLLLNNRAAVLANLDRLDEAHDGIRQALVQAERAGSARLQTIRITAGALCFSRGGWDETLLHLDAVVPPTSQHDFLLRHGLYATIAAHREDRGTATAHLEAAAAEVPAPGGYLRTSAGQLTAARAALAEAAGDLPAAVAQFASWLDPELGSTLSRDTWLPHLVRVALAAGDTGTARAAAAAAAADAASNPAPPLVAAARRCRALLDDDAPALLALADGYQQAGRGVEQAGALEEAAVRLAAAGDIPAARAALTGAVRGYQDAGASWDIRRADARLRQHGVRRGSRTFARRPTTGWAALTPAEQRIAELVAAGRSNPDIATELFLSRRTVQAHVSNILRKLDLHSRLEIVRDAPRQPTGHPA